MQIEVIGRKVDVTDAIAQHTLQRFEHALDQHNDRVRHVKVTLKDVNGPRGGVGKVCEAQIAVRGLSDMIVTKADADLYLAITAAADTAKVAVGRSLSRFKDHHVARPPLH